MTETCKKNIISIQEDLIEVYNNVGDANIQHQLQQIIHKMQSIALELSIEEAKAK